MNRPLHGLDHLFQWLYIALGLKELLLLRYLDEAASATKPLGWI